MGVVRLTRSGSNRVKWTTLASALANVSDGACTIVIGFKLAATTGASEFFGTGYLLSSTGNGVTEAGFSISAADRIYPDIGVSEDSGAPTFTSTSEQYVGIYAKGAGTVAPVLSRYVKSTNTWTHFTYSSTVADQTAATMLEIGAWENGDFFDGWVPFMACYEGAMTQVNKEALVTNWRTSDLWTNAHGQPAFLTQGNVAGASMTDLAGNASSITATGASLDAAETFNSWNFDGTGAAAATSLVIPRPPMRALIGR